jgi:HrpA-like RNA helicase
MSNEQQPTTNTGGRGGRSGGRGGRGRGRGRGRGTDGGRGRGRGRSSKSPNRSNNNGNRNNYNSDNNSNNNSNNGYGNSDQNQQGQYQRKPRGQPPVPNTKKNGEKGADSHTVSESVRIKFTTILMEFREDDSKVKFQFPPDLSNTERKFLHELASQLGVKSKSSGKGENRRIVITKPDEKTKKTTNGDEDLPLLKIGEAGEVALAEHISKFPPSRTELMESIETGSSIVEAMSQHNKQLQQNPQSKNSNSTATPNSAGGVLDALDRLGIGGGTSKNNEVSTKSRPVGKRVDLSRRIASHADFQKMKQQDRKKEYEQVLKNRSKLPAYERQAEIVATVGANPVTIIKGETGCGKSTQCPQFLLDALPGANIACTQPRRISAISIAERVAQEQCLMSSSSSSSQKQQGRGEKDGVGSLVGYQVRLESASSKDTQLMFLTPGILLRKLQSSPMLTEYTHIIIDEVHERDKYTEFLLIRLRDLLPLRPDLRVVLMSATLQTEVLINYFSPSADNNNSDFYRDHPPAMLSIEGRTFPVQEFFLEHALELTQYIEVYDDDDGDHPTAENRPMSMDKLDAVLAGLTTTEVTAKCALCGMGFPGPAELGEHMGVCTGLMEDSIVENLDFQQEDDAVKTAAFSTAGMTRFLESTESDGNIEEYDDYDVDATQEAADYNFDDILEYPSKEETEEMNTEKWDGEGIFKADVDQEVNLTRKQEKYLEQYSTMYNDEDINTELLLEILHYILKTSHGEGAILVFLPGWMEISEVNMLLENTVPFNNPSKFLVLPLHSGIPSQDQRRVLRRPPPGVRKIVLSTNIAETSLTIEDVAFVVDSGRAKEKDYDPHLKTSTLQPVWVSQSSAKQRKGRAGRTKAGVCFHMFSSRRHQAMRPFVESELLRTPLEEMALMTKKLGLAPGGPDDEDGIPAFLAKAITPPHAKSISNALELLVDLGAMLQETNDLTTLGECLSVLSLEPRVGKMVIWSYLLGCTKVASQMAVAMSYKSPFALPPPHMRREAEYSKLALSNDSESDQVTVLNAILKRDQLKKRSEGTYRDWCRRNFISPSSLQMIGDLRKNISRELSSLGFVDPTTNGYHNRHDKEHALWGAAIAAGLYPNVATRKPGDVNFSTMTNRKAKIHVSSVNSLKGQPLNSKCQIPKGQIEFVCFGEMVKGSHFFTLSQTTHLPSPLPLLLLCGTSLSIHPMATDTDDGDDGDDDDEQQPHQPLYSILNLDDWIIFKCPTEMASRLVVLRSRLEGAFWNAISQPSRDPKQSLKPAEQDALDTFSEVLQSALKSAVVRY